jgi:glutathione peroxidase
MATSIHSHQLTLNNGDTLDLSEYKGKVVLIVNTASKCGFTPQYDGLEKLYQTYKDKGLMVIGCPCDQFGHQEPGNDDEISQFCTMNFGVSFPLTAKLEVNGENTAELYNTLKSEAPGLLGSRRIKWNFTKFLVNKQGKVIKRYAPTTKPIDISEDIESALSE